MVFFRAIRVLRVRNAVTVIVCYAVADLFVRLDAEHAAAPHARSANAVVRALAGARWITVFAKPFVDLAIAVIVYVVTSLFD